MLDRHATFVNLFKKHCLPLLTEKQSKDWYSQRWETLSKSKAYQNAWAFVNEELDRLTEENYAELVSLAEQVKAEIPDGAEFTTSFYQIPRPGFYVVSEPRSYQPGKRNCVNCPIEYDGKYDVWGTDGYRVVLLARRLIVMDAGKIAKAWLSEQHKSLSDI